MVVEFCVRVHHARGNDVAGASSFTLHDKLEKSPSENPGLGIAQCGTHIQLM
jgi:hypothetical protein